MSVSFSRFLIVLLLLDMHSLFFLPCLSVKLFLFGDSLVDTGNNDYLFTLSKADFAPYGIDFLPSGGQPTGRFTNGRTISDIIGQALGAKTFPPPFLSPNSVASATQSGLNYASGSAGILNETGSLYIGRVPLEKQVDHFEQSRANMISLMGENSTKKFLKKSIFSITIGSNDILNHIQPYVPFVGQNKAEPALLFQEFMLSNLTMQLKRLCKFGARKFLVAGIGPLGCIPYVRAIKVVWFEKCSTEVNEFIQGYNRKLKAALVKLKEELQRDAIFVYADSYNIFMDIINNNSHYGFENIKDPCCGGYFPPFICFGGKDTNTSSTLCEDRSKYVFWDSYHPTEAVNLIVANKLLNGDQSITDPINVRQLYLVNKF